MPIPIQKMSRNSSAIVAPASRDQVKAWDVRAAGVLDASKLASLSAANELFARNLAETFASRFDVSCEVSVRSIDMAVCDAFVEGAGETPSYFHVLILGSHAETGVLQVDSLVLLALLDCLMGGTGNTVQTPRDLTELEMQMSSEIVKTIARQLQMAWQAHGIEVRVGGQQSADQLLHVFPHSATALVPTFAINVAQVSGKFQLMLPLPSIAPFLKAAAGKAVVSSGLPASTMSRRLSGELLQTHFPVDLSMSSGKLGAKQILDLAAGQVLDLGCSAETPVTLNVGGRAAFSASPVRAGDCRAAQLIERIGNGQPGKAGTNR